MKEDAAWRVRGIRGATTADRNDREAILDATRELLGAMIRRNDIQTEDVASAWFTTTRDLDADFPAVAARDGFGWSHVALMCGHEMDVPGSLGRCLRILLHVNTARSQEEIEHVYLRGATLLRPDVAGGGAKDVAKKGASDGVVRTQRISRKQPAATEPPQNQGQLKNN